ncbi:MAG: pyridoxamine 5'-phosphate oxidase family protein [Alphaproteobacteria bacterium]|nr:pyridoxamine 5'-phosphate oxidase family protein [Alphaproteobacteria bacterium]
MNSDMTLDDVAHDCWRRLQQGADDAAAPFRFPIVATQGLSHAGPPVLAARIVVLRGADPTRREVVFHTDQRSLKFAEIAAAARVTFVFYDAQARVQLRLVAQATAHIDDAIADAAWNAAAPTSRRAYRAKRGSGATSTPHSPGTLKKWAREPTRLMTTLGGSNSRLSFAQYCLWTG